MYSLLREISIRNHFDHSTIQDIPIYPCEYDSCRSKLLLFDSTSRRIAVGFAFKIFNFNLYTSFP